MNKPTAEYQIYKFNIFWRLISYVTGVLIFVLSIAGGTAIYVNSDSDPVPLWAGIFLVFIFFGALLQGTTLIISPAISFLKMDKEGFTYRGSGISVKARWVETLFTEIDDIPLINKNNFLKPINYEVKYHNIRHLFTSKKDRET